VAPLVVGLSTSQQRHKDFVDRFERELADLPPAPPEATPAAAGDGP